MSGHSKWSTIKRKKEAEDQKRGREFGAVSKMISAAVKEGGGGDPATNPRLRTALEKARVANMPKINVQRAIDKGLGRGGGGGATELVYEGFGPGGVGVLVMVETDNRNRTAPEIKRIFEKSGGTMASSGSASYMFEKVDGEYRVKVPVPVEEATRAKVESLLGELEGHDEVVGVVTNAA